MSHFIAVVFAPLQSTEVALRRILRAGDFIWSERLQTVFPREAFWRLYGSPGVKKRHG